MDKLNILKKIYNYGETLSSEELNQIVSYINSSITAINALIDKNNGINTSHSEVRYKNSSQQPNAPQTGTDGTSDGWSATYAFPDTSNGEITWMSICFVSGDDVYGAWSTPVCVTWSNVRGSQGQQGQSGIRGSFKSRVFKRQNTRPDTPTGGTYDNPVPAGWSDGVPNGYAIIWSSLCTFYGNGLNSGWSLPAPESDSTTLDIEFSPNNIQPDAPLGNIPFSNHESEGWYDPNSANFNNVGRMIWRAERKVSNGEYDGDWVITRIYGEKGDRGDAGLSGGHYEFRYNNFTPTENATKPTKPETGSNGTSGGWSPSQTDLTDEQIRAGTATWMTQCYLSETGIFGVWTTPIRITGSNGANGEDGTEVEFIYYRNNTGVTPPTPPITQVNDWPRHLDGQGNSIGYDTITVNNQTYTWYDNPQGVTENLMWEFVCTRSKIDNSWSAYSTPVVWSKWGEKGMDGDGFEYIYKRFQTVQNWANITGDDNPANWKTNHPSEFQNTREYTGPSGKEWSDDPVGINETYKYEYVSVRQEKDGVWQDYSTPTLWSGIPGGKTEYRYAKYKGTTNNPKPTKPSAGTDGTISPWSASEVNISEAEFKDGYKVWMTQCFKTNEGIYGTWSNPIRISGANGLDGEDGSDIEFIYTTNNSGTAPEAPTASGTGNSKTFTDDDWFGKDNNGVIWTDNPSGVTSSTMYEYISVREKPAGYNQAWGAYSTPVIWSKYGEKGMDGDGIQYVFKLFDTELTDAQCTSNIPTKPNTMTNNEWIPDGWSDNPISPTSSDPYCYCSTIKKINGNWGNFEKLSLWAKYSQDGSNSTVPGPDGKGITYILTRDTYTETNWSTYCTIGHSETFGRNANDLGSSCRVDDFFIVKGTAIDGQNKFHQATFKCTAFDSSNITGTCISHIKDGDKGDPGQSITGKTGPMFYVAGIWDSGTTYTKNDYKCPVVFYDDGTNERYYYLIASSSINQNPSYNSSVWGLADNFEAIFTKVLFSNFAKFGSFIMNQDWMVSQHGIQYDASGNLTMVTGDNTTNYQNFKPASPAENLSGEVNFCPNLAIDAKTGRIYSQRMDVGGSSVFKGMVYATGGSFKGNVSADQFLAGDESGLNITVNGDAISFNQGGEQRAWFTTKNSDGTTSSGMYLYIKNPDPNAANQIITIDFTNLNFKAVGASGQRAIQQKDIYDTITGVSVAYKSNVFKGEVDGLYYSNSDLASNHLYTNSVTTYQYIKERYIILSGDGSNRLYKAKIYKQVTISAGVLTDTNNYYAIAYDPYANYLDGTKLRGTTAQGSIASPNDTVKIGSSSDSLNAASSGHLWFSTVNGAITPYHAQTGSGGGTITLYEQVNLQQGSAIVEKETITLAS